MCSLNNRRFYLYPSSAKALNIQSILSMFMATITCLTWFKMIIFFLNFSFYNYLYSKLLSSYFLAYSSTLNTIKLIPLFKHLLFPFLDEFYLNFLLLRLLFKYLCLLQFSQEFHRVTTIDINIIFWSNHFFSSVDHPFDSNLHVLNLLTIKLLVLPQKLKVVLFLHPSQFLHLLSLPNPKFKVFESFVRINTTLW